MKFNLLECTLRDGGYQVNWDFEEDFVEDYLKLCSNLELKNIEFGFRFFDNLVWRGEFAFTTEEVISKYKINDDVYLGVMLFSGQVTTEKKFDSKKLEYLFPLDSQSSRVNFVRIATYLDGLDVSYEIAIELIKKGFDVSINLMQIQNADEKVIKDFGEVSKKINLKSIYFADSVGCLFPKDVKDIVEKMKSSFEGDIGIHAHNNLGLAFVNSVSAIEAGANWVDGTLTGIGRGPGNTLTEDMFINYFQNKNTNYTDLIEFNSKHLNKLKYEKKWGSNPFYFLAGKNKIHPSYIQEMLHDDSFNTNDIVNFIDSTNFLDKESFNLSNVNFTEKLYGSTPSANKINLDEFKEKSFLILGSGKNLTKYESDIELFINKFKPTVIQLNSNNFFNQDLINYNIFLNPNKLAAEVNDNQIKIKNVITTSTLAIQNEKISYKFVDVKVANTFSQQEFYIELPSSLVLGYALMLTTFSNLENVYLAGFDGYLTSDQKNSEVNLLIDKFVKAFSQKKLISLTPSQFNLDQQSIIGLVRQNAIN
jgi:4-hydroxy 2-oxovalerate aldolase